MELATETAWWPDRELAGFEERTLVLPEGPDGPAIATLVRRLCPTGSSRAVLYIHGFNDYFFQVHMAERFLAEGYDFYALDLRGYGRSLLSGQYPNFCRDLSDYFPEIKLALSIIREHEGHDWVLLNAHSTGGLIAALFAAQAGANPPIDALFLNSPFFDFNVSEQQRKQVGVFHRLGRFAPFMALPASLSSLYGESIHCDLRGEWTFNTKWKPLNQGFPVYLGWVSAVLRGQAQVRAGLTIGCPVLVLHSSASIRSDQWDERYHSCDAVLNVEHIRLGAKCLGPQVQISAIEGGMHDLMLSAAPVREQVFHEIFAWLGPVPHS